MTHATNIYLTQGSYHVAQIIPPRHDVGFAALTEMMEADMEAQVGVLLDSREWRAVPWPEGRWEKWLTEPVTG
jgi:hypothetical protein